MRKLLPLLFILISLPAFASGITSGSGSGLSSVNGASGTITSIATTGPITGGTITTTGTIGCATCGVTSSNLSQFAATTSAQLAGVISDETGTGVLVFDTAPTLTTSVTVPQVYGGTAAGSTLSLNGTSNGSPVNAYVLLNSAGGGNVGIGTSTPSSTLSFGGNAQATIAPENGATTGNTLQVAAGNAATGSTNQAAGALNLFSGVGTGNGGSSIFLKIFAGGSSGTSAAPGIIGFTIKNSGTSPRISIGTTATSPAALAFSSLLEAPAIGVVRNPATTGSTLTISAGSAASGGTNLAAGNLVLQSGLSTGSGTGSISFATSPGVAGSTSDNTITTAMTITGAGAVGIGTAVAYGGAVLTANGLIASEGTIPTCGTGCASITANSTNTRGSMVSGSSVSAVTVNWSATLGTTPFCVISDSNSTAVADISALSTTAMTVSLASALTSVTIYWMCMQ